MKSSLIGLLLIIIGSQGSFAQNASTEQEIKDLSKAKWQWMSDKNVDKLNTLFHDSSKFVHMSDLEKDRGARYHQNRENLVQAS